VGFVLHQGEQQHQPEEHHDQDHELKNQDQAQIIDQVADFQCAQKLTTAFANSTRSGQAVIALKDGSKQIVNRCAEHVDRKRSEHEQQWFDVEWRVWIAVKTDDQTNDIWNVDLNN